MSKTELQARVAKLSANDQALLIAYLNASLATWDSKIPRKIRIDRDTLELYSVCPVLEESGGIAKMVRPILAALKAAKKRGAK